MCVRVCVCEQFSKCVRLVALCDSQADIAPPVLAHHHELRRLKVIGAAGGQKHTFSERGK